MSATILNTQGLNLRINRLRNKSKIHRKGKVTLISFSLTKIWCVCSKTRGGSRLRKYFYLFRPKKISLCSISSSTTSDMTLCRTKKNRKKKLLLKIKHDTTDSLLRWRHLKRICLEVSERKFSVPSTGGWNVQLLKCYLVPIYERISTLCRDCRKQQKSQMNL